MWGAVIVMLRSRVLRKVHSKDHAVTAPRLRRRVRQPRYTTIGDSTASSPLLWPPPSIGRAQQRAAVHQRGAPGEPASVSRRSADYEVGKLAVRRTRGAPDVGHTGLPGISSPVGLGAGMLPKSRS